MYIYTSFIQYLSESMDVVDSGEEARKFEGAKAGPLYGRWN